LCGSDPTIFSSDPTIFNAIYMLFYQFFLNKQKKFHQVKKVKFITNNAKHGLETRKRKKKKRVGEAMSQLIFIKKKNEYI
jgi:hypothetical protein